MGFSYVSDVVVVTRCHAGGIGLLSANKERVEMPKSAKKSFAKAIRDRVVWVLKLNVGLLVYDAAPMQYISPPMTDWCQQNEIT